MKLRKKINDTTNNVYMYLWIGRKKEEAVERFNPRIPPGTKAQVELY